jgi:DNA mismatch endonuclease (patch repair protein)
MPSTRPEFWQAKFEANAARDNAVRATLLAEGWRVATVWECALRKAERVELAADILATWLQGDVPELEIDEKDVVAEIHGPCLASHRRSK